MPIEITQMEELWRSRIDQMERARVCPINYDENAKIRAL
jgi:hypothetical protein